jgi:hypothetical protein
MIYVPKPSALMSSGSHSPSDATRGEIPEEFHPVLESYAKFKAAQYSNDAPSQNGQMFKQEWEQGVVESKMILARKAGMKVSRANIGGSRNAAWRYAPPGVDRGY